MRQDDKADTPADRATWATLYERQTEALRGRSHPAHAEGLAAFGITPDLPDIGRLNGRLEAAVGWAVEPVAGQVPGAVFSALLARHRLPTTVHLRSSADLAHSKEPDMFHDIFGHVPLLFVAECRRFLARFGEVSKRLLHHAAASSRLGNAFKWTIEYGLISDGGVRAYGAGLMSSSEELDHALDARVPKRAFTPSAALGTAHTPAELQSQYFVIDGFGQLEEEFERIVREAEASEREGRG